MNQITKEIAAMFGITLEQAKEVQDIEEVWCPVRYLNDSARVINAAHREAYAIWQAGGADVYYKAQA